MSIRLLRTDRTDELVFETFHEHQLWKRPSDCGLCPDYGFSDDNDDNGIRFAILSHRWREGEVEFPDCKDIMKARQKSGWAKLHAFMRLARSWSIRYVWADTCCIDKSSSTELAEALNSMFKWYELAYVCVAYLDDVLNEPDIANPVNRSAEQCVALIDGLRSRHKIDWKLQETMLARIGLRREEALLVNHKQLWVPRQPSGLGARWSSMRTSEWFTRGWTLQELIAPSSLLFFDTEWNLIGHRAQLATLVEQITGIDTKILQNRDAVHDYSVAQKISWAANRTTTREEDRAYSLLGLLDVNLNIIYGEGKRAFLRLQEELLRSSADSTIFAWQYEAPQFHDEHGPYSDLLASSPDVFKESGKIVPIIPHRRSHHVIGSQVRFDMKLFKPLDRKPNDYERSGTQQVIIGCHQDDASQLLTLKVVPASQSPNTYLVTGPANRYTMESLWKAAATPDANDLRVWRKRLDALYERSPISNSILLCRSADPRLEVVAGEPADLWDPQNQFFKLRMDFQGSMKIRVHGSRSKCLSLTVGRPQRHARLAVNFPWSQDLNPPAWPWIQDLRHVQWCQGQIILASVYDLDLLDFRTQVLEISLLSIEGALLRAIASTLRRSSASLPSLLPIIKLLVLFATMWLMISYGMSSTVEDLNHAENSGLTLVSRISIVAILATAWMYYRRYNTSSILSDTMYVVLRERGLHCLLTWTVE